MFGSRYRNHPEILIQSLHQMNDSYADKFTGTSLLKNWLAKFYISLFGIPEIGFQVRGIYFRQAIGSLHAFKPRAILDIGSGIGCYALYLAAKYPKTKVTGWEIDRSKLKESNKLLKEFGTKNAAFVYGDIAKRIEYKNTYQLVFIIDVMEHIEDYKKVLKNMYKLVTPGGYIYIHVPQVNQQRIFYKLKSWKHEDHVREGFEPILLARELREVGFRVISRRNTFGFFGSLAWELNHMILAKSQIFTALCYPFIYGLSLLDSMIHNRRGLGVAILAQKI